MKFQDVSIQGDLTMTGSFQIPYGFGTGSYPQSPGSGSLFLDTSNNLVYVANTGSWGIVGTQTTPPPAVASADIEYLVVAGGGGGGGGGWGAGGGGAGGMLSSSLSSIESGSSITVTVGGGGTGRGGGNTFTAGGDGVASSIESSTGTTFTTVNTVGGGGGGAESANSGLGRDGGSGGGSTQNNASGGSGTAGQGNDGGAGTGGSSPGYPGGGGGGKGSVGSTPSGNNGGDGGTGQASSITGTSTNYAGGGGGGTRTSGAQGTGGSSIGGDGANASTAATSATVNRGSGGGGAGNAAGSNGSSGVVILAYPTSSISATGGVRTFFNDRVAHTFQSSGTFSVGGIKTYTHNTLDIFGDGSCKALYKFEGNANDESGNYNGTASGITYDQSYINNGAVFTGNTNALAGSKVTVSNSVYGTNKSYFSISGWVKYGTTSSELPIFGNGGTVGGTTGYAVYTYLGEIIITFRTDPNQNFYYSGEYLDDNEWHHIALTFDGGDYVLYIDNNVSLSGTTTNYTTNPTPTYDTHFGNRFSRNETGVLNGSMDQVRIFDRALTASEVATLYIE